MGLSEEVKNIVERIMDSTEYTSANPLHTNRVKQFGSVVLPDLDEMIREGKDAEDIKEKTDIKNAVEQVKTFDKGNVGDVQRFTREQFGNVREFATNPFGFVVGTVFGKFAKGVGVLALALVFFEVVKFIIGELLKPGRFLDRRFKRDITRELLIFRSREEKQKLRQGRSNIIVTTIGGLRGGAGQRSSTYRAYAGLQPQLIPNNFVVPTTEAQSSGQDLSRAKGKRTRFRG